MSPQWFPIFRLPRTLALVLAACAGEAAPFREDGRADDLIGQEVEFERTSPTRLEVGQGPLVRRVASELRRQVPERSVTWLIEDLRVAIPKLQEGEWVQLLLRDSDEFEGVPELETNASWTRFGFIIECRQSPEASWEEILPVEGVIQRYYWTHFFTNQAGQVLGEAYTVADAWGSLTAHETRLDIDRLDDRLVEGAEIRLSVFPVWDYWSFDLGFEYETLIHVDVPEATAPAP